MLTWVCDAHCCPQRFLVQGCWIFIPFPQCRSRLLSISVMPLEKSEEIHHSPAVTSSPCISFFRSETQPLHLHFCAAQSHVGGGSMQGLWGFSAVQQLMISLHTCRCGCTRIHTHTYTYIIILRSFPLKQYFFFSAVVCLSVCLSI